MKICFCVSAMESGGAERVVSLLANEFNSQGHAVTIIMVSSNIKKTFYDLAEGIDLIPLCCGFNKKVKFFKRIKLLKQKLLFLQPDIVVSFLSHINIYSYFATRKTNIPIVVSERNDPKSEPKKIAWKIIRNWVFKKSDGCVLQTDDASSYFKKVKAKIVIPNPVCIQEINKEIKTRKHSIVMVGSSKKEKNRSLAFSGFLQFHKNHSDYVLRIYGSPFTNSEKVFLQRNNLDSAIVYMGKKQDWYSGEIDSSAFILTSDFEGMPNALLEAACLKIPCISTDCPCGGPRSILENGNKGLLFKCGDVDDFVSKLSLLCDSQELQNKLSNANKNTLDRYLPSRIAFEWLTFFDRIMKKHG